MLYSVEECVFLFLFLSQQFFSFFLCHAQYFDYNDYRSNPSTKKKTFFFHSLSQFMDQLYCFVGSREATCLKETYDTPPVKGTTMKWCIQTLYELKLGLNSTFIPWPTLQPSLPRFFLLLQRKTFDIKLVSNFYNVLDSHCIQIFFIPFSHTEDLMWTEHNWTECCIRTSVLMKRSVQTNVLIEKKSSCFFFLQETNGFS